MIRPPAGLRTGAPSWSPPPSPLTSALQTGSSSLWPSTLPVPEPNSTFTRLRPPRRQDLYQAPISYAAQPKADKRDRLYVRAEVLRGQLGISSVHLPCEVLRDYFYVANRHQPWERQTSLYDTVRIAPVASLADLRLAFRLRQLELQAAGAPKAEQATLERAFNLLARRSYGPAMTPCCPIRPRRCCSPMAGLDHFS